MRSLFRTLHLTAACAAGFLGASLALRAQSASAPATLKDTYRGLFHLGVALNPGQFTGTNAPGAALVLREFDSITPENALKWNAVEPADGEFSFDLADRYVDFGVKNKLFVIGHNLCWHNQLPAWVSRPPAGQDTLTKDVLLERLRRHITTVAGRYRGKIHGWDVVNEAINDGAGDYRQTVFYRVIGKEYLPLAFKWAHEAAPDAELYYNDYNLDANDAKRATAIELVKYLREQGAPIHGIGLQGHYNLTSPSPAKVDETIRMFAALGLKVMITELDVQVVRNAGVTGAVGAARGGMRAPPTPLTAEQQQALAQRYADLFAVFLKHRDAITRVTFWGLRDADSWRRASSPLLFDDNYQPKPAHAAVLEAVKAASAAAPR